MTTPPRFGLNRFDARSVDDRERGFMARVARGVLPPVRAALGAR
jgi:hypothetical protein